MYMIILYQIVSRLEPHWNQIDVDSCFLQIDCSKFNVQPNNKYNAIAKYVESKLQVSIMAEFWYLSDTDQCCIPAKIFEKLSNAHKYICVMLFSQNP